MRILHVLRSPVGGLFRHVRDLATEQAAQGHDVGIVCDSLTGGDGSRKILSALQPALRLGVHQFAMRRLPHPSDLSHVRAVRALLEQHQVEIVHGHGAKGGLYARLAGRGHSARSVYTPHGGSLHYSWSSPSGAVFLAMEKALNAAGDGLVFVCDFERRLFGQKIGLGKTRNIVVQNGLTPPDFADVPVAAGASDFIFVGEMRALKGVDLLLSALAGIDGATLTLVGDGPDQATFEAQAKALGLSGRVHFAGRLPMTEALKRGRILVVPSRHESFPYVVLEGLAAGRLVLASQVGGIPEVVPTALMFPADDAVQLKNTLHSALKNPHYFISIAHKARAILEQRNTVAAMTAQITEFYRIL